MVACALENFETADDSLSKGVGVKAFFDPADEAFLWFDKVAPGALEAEVGQKVGHLDAGGAPRVRRNMEAEADLSLAPLEPYQPKNNTASLTRGDDVGLGS